MSTTSTVNRYVIYDKKTGKIHGTCSKHVLGKESPVPLTEGEIVQMHGDDFPSIEIGALKLPEAFAIPSRGMRLSVNTKKQEVVAGRVTTSRHSKKKS